MRWAGLMKNRGHAAGTHAGESLEILLRLDCMDKLSKHVPTAPFTGPHSSPLRSGVTPTQGRTQAAGLIHSPTALKRQILRANPVPKSHKLCSKTQCVKITHFSFPRWVETSDNNSSTSCLLPVFHLSALLK